MYTWSYLSPLQRAAVDGLPAEAAAALQEFLAAVELDPWGVAGWSRQRGNMPTAVFGPGGMGQVTFLILDEAREVVVTQVLWLG